MPQPYVGEIRMFAGNFPPAQWAFCDGQLLPISENETLFTLIGTTYGGDGVDTFALPDLRGRIPLHSGNGFTLAQTGGVETVTLTQDQIPKHRHTLFGTTSSANQTTPQADTYAQSLTVSFYNSAAPNAAMAPSALTPAGGSQPHENFQPYLCVDFIISLFGIFPSQT